MMQDIATEQPVDLFDIGKLIERVPYQKYHDFGAKIGSLRASHLSELRISPAHLRYVLDNPKEETEALRQGKLIHSALENPERFMDTVMIEPVFTGPTLDGKESTKSKAAKEKRAEWLLGLKPGTNVISQPDAVMVTGIINSIANNRLTKRLLKNGVREVSGWVKDPETGLTLQYRPDFIHEDGYVIDYKSTRCAHPSFFNGEIFSLRQRFYILSSAHYAHCTKLMGMNKNDSFTIIAVEKKPPYGLNVYALGREHLSIGEYYRKELTKLYAKCVKENLWPCYEEKAINPEIPAYVKDMEIDEVYYEEEGEET